LASAARAFSKSFAFIFNSFSTRFCAWVVARSRYLPWLSPIAWAALQTRWWKSSGYRWQHTGD